MPSDASSSIPEQDFGTMASVGGIAGDSSVGVSDMNGSLPSKRAMARSDLSFYENDSVMLWSDDVEKEYFNYILQREAENRAKKGKSADDSLIGESTLDEIQQEFSKWHENGGGEPGQDQSVGLPVLSVSHRSHRRPTLDGFSLATTERSPKRTPAVQLNIPEQSPKKDSKVLPDVIYVTDTPATSVSLSKPSKGSDRFGSGRGRTCMITSLFIMGGVCLAAATIGIYVTITTNQANKNVASSIQNTPVVIAMPIAWPASTPKPTMAPSPRPSFLRLVNTKMPVANDNENEHVMQPNENSVTSPPSTQQSDNQRDPPAGSQPTPASAEPTPSPTPSPTTLPQSPSILYCGCKNCEVAMDRIADGYSCKERMRFLMNDRGFTEVGACRQVSSVEFPAICGLCNPDSCEVAAAVESFPAPAPSEHPLTIATPEPTAIPLLELELHGNNGRPLYAFPLGECEGKKEQERNMEQAPSTPRVSNSSFVPL